MPVHGIYARHVRGITFNNVRMNVLTPDARPATAFIDVEDLRENSAAPATSPSPATRAADAQ
jgi:hypothetical protein